MADMFTDFASGAGQVLSNVGSKLAQGIGDIVVERSEIGPLLDPFIETTREKERKPFLEEQKKQMAFAEESREFTREQRQRTKDVQQQQDEVRELKRQELFIDANKERATKNFMNQLESRPEYNNLTDVQKNAYLKSQPAQDMINFRTLARVGVDAASDPRKIPTLRRALNQNDMDLIQKDGKYFVTQPGRDEEIELTDENFTAMMNGMQAQAAEELQSHALFVAQESNLMGQSKNNMVTEIMRQSAINNPTGTPKSMSTAFKEVDTFLKANNFTPQQLRINYVNTGLTKVFEDGNISADEREEVMAQLQFLGDAIGIRSRQTADGGIEVMNPANNGWVPLKAFYDSLQAPGADVVADRFNAVTSLKGDEPATPFDEEFSEISTDIPEENASVVKQSILPIMEETGIDSKERKSFAMAVSDIIDFDKVEGDPVKIYDNIKNVAEDRDVDEDKLISILPEEIQRAANMQIAKEAEAESKRVFKEAVKRKEKQKKRLKAFSEQQKKLQEVRKGLPSGFGF